MLPASFSLDEFRTNYGGDLKAARYFTEQEITYRIVTDGATDIRLQPIRAALPSPVQSGDIRGAFAKIEAELAKNAPSGRRTFVDVTGTNLPSLIDVVVQSPDDFGDRAGGAADIYGTTSPYARDRNLGILGRSVVRIRDDLPERVFRHTALHEALHAVGLNGHSRRIGVVLQSDQSPVLSEVRLTEYDSNTLRACYTR